MKQPYNKLDTIDHRTNSMAAANTGFASGGVTCKIGALCFYSSSVLVDSFVLRNPPERKARKRCVLLYCQTQKPDAILRQEKIFNLNFKV